MKLIQYHGPFAAGTNFSVEADTRYRYTHIGIEVPQPRQMRDSVLIPEIKIGSANQSGTVAPRYNDEFKMNKNGILEFDGLASLNYSITIKEDLPMEATIEISYRNIED